MNRNGPLALAFHGLFIVFMVAPILIVCVVAFTPTGFLSIPTTEWSLRWFRAIARYPEFVQAFWNSLGLGALSSTIAVALSVPAALAIARHRFAGREAITAIFMSPLMIPHVVLGIAFAAVAIIIISASIRMTVLARAREIGIMRLVGATDAFVRRPFVLDGFAKGVLGGLLALGFTWTAHTVVSRSFLQTDFFPPQYMIVGVIAGALLGSGVSALSVRRHLKRIQ